MKNKLTSFFVLFLGILASLMFFFNIKNSNILASEKNFVKNRQALVKYKNNDKIETVNIPDEVNIEQFILNLENNNNIDFVEPNYSYKAAIIPSDTYYGNQWYLQKIKAVDAWNTTRESNDKIIAIIDSGVQINHPDLKENIWINDKEIPDNNIDDDNNGFIDDINGWDFVANTPDPNPKFEEGYTSAGILHGTIVAGVAAASGNNASGVSGVTWRARIMPLRVLDGKGEGDTNNVVKAVDYAVANGADIINFSFVGFGSSQALERAIRRAYNAGVVIVAAAGNEQNDGDGYFLDETPMYPVCHDGNLGENMVIGVAATDALDQKANFSSYGFKCVDVSAPGVSIFSTSVYNPEKSNVEYGYNKYYDGYWSGTSMAAPMVSAAVSLVSATAPGFNRNEIIAAIVNNSDNINRLNQDFLGQMGMGRLNVNSSVVYVKNSLYAKSAKIIFAPQKNAASTYVIADKKGNKEGEFFAYSKNFHGGVNVAAGDVDGDGIAEIITGAGNGGGPHVRIFALNGAVKGQFFAYDKNFRGGINVAAGRFNGGSRGAGVKIVTAPKSSGGSHVKIFNYNGKLINHFFAYNKNFHGGVSLAVIDIDNDSIDDIITGAGPGGAPHVRVFNSNNKLKYSFYAFDKFFSNGVNVGGFKF
ncbi:MAG: S8 family peptidase [Patescibacteria group bacterium]|nr:S8 family peptidase [Patescibacteria group bacterium]